MRKSKSILKGFISAHFFRHSAGIAVFMLFTLSLMSFKYDDKKPVINKSSKKDSTYNGTNKDLSYLLGNDLSDVTIDKSIFKLRPSLASFVKSFVKRESKDLGNMKAWGKPYFELYDSILSLNGLPVELKYLSVIESNLVSSNITGGAVGPWQLMPDEGRRFGLAMKRSYDERTSYTKSTKVAATLLKELYGEFGNWLLVVGAYNCGMGRMKQAIAKAGNKDYWKLEQYLPEETRNHVKKFIATHYFFEGCGGWTTITTTETASCKATLAKLKATRDASLANNNIAASEITGKYSSSVIIRSLAIDPSLFNQLNPAFDKTLTEGKTYSLKLPESKMPLFITNRQQILEKSVQLGLTASLNTGS